MRQSTSVNKKRLGYEDCLTHVVKVCCRNALMCNHKWSHKDWYPTLRFLDLTGNPMAT